MASLSVARLLRDRERDEAEEEADRPDPILLTGRCSERRSSLSSRGNAVFTGGSLHTEYRNAAGVLS